jgi:hypothetical protein
MSCCQRHAALVKAIATVRSHYPESVFPEDGTSQDAQSGTFARHLCDQILQLADEGFRDGPEYAYCSYAAGLDEIDTVRNRIEGEVRDLKIAVTNLRLDRSEGEA